MPAYTVIKNSQITHVITCPSECINDQLSEGETVIDGAYPPDVYELIEGEPVQRSEPIIQPRKPSLHRLQFGLEHAGLRNEAHLPRHDQWTKEHAKSAIDQAAGRARYRLAADGVYVSEEYWLTEQAVLQWRADGSPETNVPDEILCWAEAKGWTNEQAAQDIEYNALGFKYIIALIRRHRLIGKAAVDAAESDFAIIAQPFIDQLNAL